MHTLSRRTLIGSLGVGAAFTAVPVWAQGHSVHRGGLNRKGPLIPAGFGEVGGPVIDLSIGSVPGPLIRLTEGQNVRLNLTNTLSVDSSVHWHGLLLPFQYDGVPGISFLGIKPGKTFTYEFPIRQSGTYWYHSHSGLQEQSGHYGPMIIEPRGPDRGDGISVQSG